MTKAVHRRKGLFGLMAPEGGELITITMGKGGSRHGVWSRKLGVRILNHKQEASEEDGDGASLWTISKSTPSDIFPLAKPCLLRVLRQHHQLGTKHSNAGDHGGQQSFNSVQLAQNLKAWG